MLREISMSRGYREDHGLPDRTVPSYFPHEAIGEQSAAAAGYI
jgi:hypothetical protein